MIVLFLLLLFFFCDVVFLVCFPTAPWDRDLVFSCTVPQATQKSLEVAPFMLEVIQLVSVASYFYSNLTSLWRCFLCALCCLPKANRDCCFVYSCTVCQALSRSDSTLIIASFYSNLTSLWCCFSNIPCMPLDVFQLPIEFFSTCLDECTLRSLTWLLHDVVFLVPCAVCQLSPEIAIRSTPVRSAGDRQDAARWCGCQGMRTQLHQY